MVSVKPSGLTRGRRRWASASGCAALRDQVRSDRRLFDDTRGLAGGECGWFEMDYASNRTRTVGLPRHANIENEVPDFKERLPKQ